MDRDTALSDHDPETPDPARKTTLDYAVIDRCPDTGWSTVVFFDWATEALRHVRERLSGELNFVVYDLDAECHLGLGELAKRAEQEKSLRALLSKAAP